MGILIICIVTIVVSYALGRLAARQRAKNFDYMVATKVYQNLSATQLYKK